MARPTDPLVISGAVHYFRIHPDLWADRLRRLRAMGCTHVETYVAWNYHAPSPGVVDFTGPRDLGRFLDLAAEAGLAAIVRPGPYICAEWEGGGLPGWLRADPQLRLRSSDPAYQGYADAWLDAVVPVIVARQPEQGGRVVMVQVENEYGSFGDDAAHLEHLCDGLRERGVTVPLVTSDGPGDQWLLAGTVEGATPTINFGSRAAQRLAEFRASRPGTPAMCMEFWNGWFDHWGEPHHVRDPQDAAGELAEMLGGGMSVNFYMAHGGTNLGLWNGCNHDGVLQPTVTSYDYDAPIAEHGALTPKFHAFREVIGRHVELPDLPEDLAAEPRTLAPRELREVGRGMLTCDDLEQLARSTVDQVPGLRLQDEPTPMPPTFEELGLERGLLLLRAEVDHPGGTVELRLHGLHDRAHVVVDGRLAGIAGRDEGAPEPVAIHAEAGRCRLDVLVESQGRINFGPHLLDRKGLLGGAWFGTRYVMGWRAFPLALDVIGAELAEVCRELTERGEVGGQDGLGFGRYALRVGPEEDRVDAFVDTSSRGRGMLLVDDQLLGRYWSIGPQQTLYCPGPYLTAGEHVLTALDTDPAGGEATLALAARPDLGPVQAFVPEG